jgi:hypothetical protein
MSISSKAGHLFAPSGGECVALVSMDATKDKYWLVVGWIDNVWALCMNVYSMWLRLVAVNGQTDHPMNHSQTST